PCGLTGSGGDWEEGAGRGLGGSGNVRWRTKKVSEKGAINSPEFLLSRTFVCTIFLCSRRKTFVHLQVLSSRLSSPSLPTIGISSTCASPLSRRNSRRLTTTTKRALSARSTGSASTAI